MDTLPFETSSALTHLSDENSDQPESRGEEGQGASRVKLRGP